MNKNIDTVFFITEEKDSTIRSLNIFLSMVF